MKNKIILSLIILIFISISAVSAADNSTDEISFSDEMYDEEIEYDYGSEAFISADNYNSFYDSGKRIAVHVDDGYGYSADDVCVGIKYSSGSNSYGYTNGNGNVYFDVYKNVGNYKATLFLKNSKYTAPTLTINVKITKAPVKLTAVKTTSKTNQYATLKAIVKDKWGNDVNQGTVKFKINGKSYSVKVHDGIATKKVKLTKVKTYTYKATFTAKNYKSKTSSSKVVVKKAPKTYFYKKGKYSFRVSQSQQNKIKYVKNHKHSSHLSKYADFKVKTGKYYNGLPVYAVVSTWSGIQNGRYLNYPQVQFVVMYGKSTWQWDYLTAHYKI